MLKLLKIFAIRKDATIESTKEYVAHNCTGLSLLVAKIAKDM